MSVTSDFYLARAAECAQEAEASLLDNVRDRCHRSEAVWRTMADRLTHSEKMRSAEAAAKVARTQAEP
jgi:hypothetical protein